MAVGAIVGTSAIAVAEFDVLLQVVGIFAIGQLLVKLLDANEREKTFAEVKNLIDKQIAPADLPQDLARVASTLLEVSEVSSSPAAASTEAPAAPAAAEDSAVPANVREAREWIKKWQARK